MNRRSLLRTLAYGAAGAALVPRLWPQRARATAPQVDRVLELFLLGGASQYESFYHVPERDSEDPLYAFEPKGSHGILTAISGCGGRVPDAFSLPFARDAGGQLVHLGPAADAFATRPDLLSRMRYIVQSHDVQPHEGAVPLALTGRRLGDPLAAGMGAHVGAYFTPRDSGSHGPRAYVLSESVEFNASAAGAVGAHGGAARPLWLRPSQLAGLARTLRRQHLSERARGERDRGLARMLERYRTRTGGGPALDVLTHVVDQLAAAPALASRFEGLSPRLATECGEPQPHDTGTALDLAVRLLSIPDGPRHVTVVDAGIRRAPGGGGYDSHSSNSVVLARNLRPTLHALVERLAAPGVAPSPGRLSLDRTLVQITSEFGRTPMAEGTSGRDHHPYGYVTVWLGGPIATPGIDGGLDALGLPTGARPLGPGAERAATLLALGVWPFGPAGFAVSDIPGASSETEAVAILRARYFGEEA